MLYSIYLVVFPSTQLKAHYVYFRDNQIAQWWRSHLPMQDVQFRFLGREDPLEKEMATHSSILAWRIPWTEEPGGVWATVHGIAKSRTQAPTCIHHSSMYTTVIFRTLKTGRSPFIILITMKPWTGWEVVWLNHEWVLFFPLNIGTSWTVLWNFVWAAILLTYSVIRIP